MVITDKELIFIISIIENGGNESKALDDSKLDQYDVVRLTTKILNEYDRRHSLKRKIDDYNTEKDNLIIEEARQEKLERKAAIWFYKKSRKCNS